MFRLFVIRKPLAGLSENSWIRTQVMHLIPSGLSSPAEAAPVLWYHVWWRSPYTRPDRASPARRPLHPHPTYSLLTQHTRVLHSCTVTGPGQRSKVIPGMLRAAHASLFLLFLSFLNLGTRRNLALRLRLEKSDSWPCTQTHIRLE